AENYPDAGEKQKKILTEKLLKDILLREGDNVQTSITKVQQNIDGATGSRRKTPYLLASDSFHFYQLTQQLLETGRISETIQGSKYLNTLMLAPKGHFEPITLHPYVGAICYRLLRQWRPAMDLMEALGYVPLILSGLSLMAFLAVCYVMNSALWSTFIGSIFFFCSPIFIKRSAYGWYDNDPYNTLFPLLILGVLFTAFGRTPSLRRSVMVLCSLSVLMLVYALFWQGWMMMFMVAGIGLGIVTLYSRFMERSPSTAKQEGLVLGGFGILTFVLIGLAFGPKEFFLLFQEGYKALQNFLVPQLSLWPDLYISVGELHQANLFEIVVITGGFIFTGLALAGLIFSFFRWRNPQHSRQFKMVVVLAVFLGMSILITLGAQRFALLCLTPLSLLCVLGMDHFLALGDGFSGKFANIPLRRGAWLAVRLVLATAVISPLLTLQRQMPKLLNPIYNDTWDAALVDIAEGTPQNSIINSWWPPGHFIKATARRRVTFDGATINFPQAYW
ncbi:MAG: dolichyl-diphosphooligosaccharide--protein glycosyltransferase subunit STT3, partial [Candidatus Omnitrophica bacterium]|nr:dolichyl-diphosphooligosaccharide--protein glycosyltransferase subunit STT3 [Candidatus Omnitrophota bacterium]